MKILLSILCFITLASCSSNKKDECLKIKCLSPRDSVSKKTSELKTYFLIESAGDTISNFDIRSSCGCEYPVWNKEMKIYPGHPDTVMIVSSIKDHMGHWSKQTTIKAGDCIQVFNTGPWIITD